MALVSLGFDRPVRGRGGRDRSRARFAVMKRTDQELHHYTPAGAAVQPKGSYTDFMCDCQEKGKQRCEQVMAEVCEELKTEPERLVTAVVFSLTWGLKFAVSVTGIPCDMWCAVTAEMVDQQTGDQVATFFIQCDKVEYGFARLWQMAKEAACA